MSKFDEGIKRAVFAKGNGLCHLCWKPMAYSNYASHGSRGAWEIDHSVPRAQGRAVLII
jgi:5-methylcytosine-specific restriction endonuclease McrA